MTVNNTELCDKLWKQVLAAVTSGNKAVVLLGFNEVMIELVSRFNANGLGNLVSGLADPNPGLHGRVVGDQKILSIKELRSIDIDTLVITSDRNKEDIIISFSEIDNRTPKIIVAGMGHLEFQDELYHEIFSSSYIPSRAFGHKNMLIHIFQAIKYIAEHRIEGSFAEFGVYKGGTTVFMARVLEHLGYNAKIYAFDTFGGFPGKKSVFDMYDDPHDEYFDFEAVSNYCKPHNIELIKGDINETYRRIEGIPLAFSFFDTDNYSPTKSALEICFQQTVPGGILAFDHYFCDERWVYTLGERLAIKEFVDDRKIFNLYGTGIFLKL